VSCGGAKLLRTIAEKHTGWDVWEFGKPNHKPGMEHVKKKKSFMLKRDFKSCPSTIDPFFPG